MDEHANRPTRAAVASNGPGPLSPAFGKADDAARWAHRVIGKQRDVEYGGVILKRGIRYYATQPVADQRSSFDHTLVLGPASDGKFVVPEGYVGEAFYHSHPAAAADFKVNLPDFTDDQIALINNFYSIPDQAFSIKNREFAKTHYLSGPNNVLLKYVSSGSAIEKKLYQDILNQSIESTNDFETVIWRFADAGELSVLIANPAWGGTPGRVTRGWRLNTPLAAVGEVTLQPFCTRLADSPETAVTNALSAAPVSTQDNWGGFVLKHTKESAYIATLPSSKTEPLFSPTTRFPTRGDGQCRLPPQYRLVAVYFRAAQQGNAGAAREAWLAECFFSPAQVVAAITQARATLAIQAGNTGLAVYLKTTDGGLLKLKVPTPSAAADLVNEGENGVLGDNGAQAALVAGSLTPRQYIRRVIAATEVSVVNTGKLWRDIGPLDNHSPVLTAFYRASWNGEFLSANDAALYAHEQIGNRRDRNYGGYVLKGANGRFVVTAPMECASNPFDGMLFFPAGDQGPLIPPEHYEVQGRYGSHPALSMVDPQWVHSRGWTRDQALINLQVFAPDEILSILREQHVAYLSAGIDCLLGYSPNGSSHEQQLLDSLPGNTVQSRMPVQWVSQLAEGGALRVIDSNPLWGPRSVVGSSWIPHSTYAPRIGPPDYTLFGAVFKSANEAALNLHSRVHGRNLRMADCFAFILKHKDQEQYVASEVECVDNTNTLFKLNSLFARTAPGVYRFPEGFVLHALFRSQQWKPSGLDTASAWLTTYFVMPKVLYIALYESSRRGQKYNSGNNLPMYFSTVDGALLRYVPQPITIGQAGAIEIELEETQKQLAGGRLTPRDFLRRWADRGRLEVLRTSQCWGRIGHVSTTWSGYEGITRRKLSPAFANADDAARYAAALVGQGRQRLYGGVILRFANGLFAATEPLAVPAQGFTFDWIYPDPIVATGLYPAGSTLVARYSSRVQQEVPILLSVTQKALYTSMIPSATLSNLLHREAHLKREYVFGPQGSVLSYELSNSTAEVALKNQLAPRNLVKVDLADNDIEQAIRAGSLQPDEFVSRVARAGTLRVIVGNALWGPERPIGTSFIANVLRPAAFEVRAAFADPPCTPVCTRAFDAVRHVHLGYEAGAQVAFGFVLKAEKKPFYMATLPLVRARYADLNQTFATGKLPQGYVLEGLYLCADEAAIAGPDDDMSYSFFDAQVIANALNFVSQSNNGSVLTLYLMCGDGALLRYALAKPQSLPDFMSRARGLREQMLEGSTRVLDYVRELADMGDLQVRLTSRIWGRKERVTAQWQSQRQPHSFSSDPYFHSFCGPLFIHADDAARAAHKQLGPYTGKQYLGAVLVPPLTSGYVAIEPVEDAYWGPGELSSLQRLFWVGRTGFDVPRTNALFAYGIAAVQAFYKVIASTTSTEPLDLGLLDNFVSTQDLARYVDILKSNSQAAQSCYLVCRGGAVLKYIPGYNTQETALLNPSLPSTPSQLVDKLRRVGELWVLDTDTYWTRVGQLKEQWQTRDVQQAPDDDAVQFGRDKDEL